MRNRLRVHLPLAGAILLALLPFREFLGSGVPVGRDLLFYFFPLKAHLVEAVTRGELPWVDRFRWGGSPLLGAPSAAPFDPANVLFVLLPLGTAMKAWILLHLAVALAGFAAFARRLGLERAPAAVAGLVFALGGTTVSLAAFPAALSALSILPWFAAFVVRPREGAGKTRDGGRGRRGGPHPRRDAARIRVLRGVRRRRGLLLGARRRRDVAARGTPAGSPRGERASRRRPRRDLAPAGGRHGRAQRPVAGGRHGPRGRGDEAARRRRDFPSFSSTGWSRTGRSSASAPRVPDYPYLPSLTPGRVAWVARPRRAPSKRARTDRGALLALFGTLLALGDATPVFGLAAGALPPLGWIRYPEKHMILAGFGLAWLAALGLSPARPGRLAARSARSSCRSSPSPFSWTGREWRVASRRSRTRPCLTQRPPLLAALPEASGDAPPPRLFFNDAYQPAPVYDTRDIGAASRVGRETLLPAYASLFGVGYQFEVDYDLSLSAEAFEWTRLLSRAVPETPSLALRFVRGAGVSAIVRSEPGADGRYRPHLVRIGNALPPYRFATHVVASADARSVFARLLEDGFSADTAYVDAALPGVPASARGGPDPLRGRPAFGTFSRRRGRRPGSGLPHALPPAGSRRGGDARRPPGSGLAGGVRVRGPSGAAGAPCFAIAARHALGEDRGVDLRPHGAHARRRPARPAAPRRVRERMSLGPAARRRVALYGGAAVFAALALWAIPAFLSRLAPPVAVRRMDLEADAAMETEAVKLLREYVRIDTSNPPGHHASRDRVSRADPRLRGDSRDGHRRRPGAPDSRGAPQGPDRRRGARSSQPRGRRSGRRPRARGRSRRSRPSAATAPTRDHLYRPGNARHEGADDREPSRDRVARARGRRSAPRHRVRRGVGGGDLRREPRHGVAAATIAPTSSRA